MSDAVYTPILDVLSDHKPRNLGELATAVEGSGLSLRQVMEAVIVLSAGVHLAPVQGLEAARAASARCDRLNAFLCARARSHSDAGFVASRVTGGGVGLGRFDQLFLAGLKAGAKTPVEGAQRTWEVIAAQGQKLLKEGRRLESAEENLAELGAQAKTFHEAVLPVLRGLGVA